MTISRAQGRAAMPPEGALHSWRASAKRGALVAGLALLSRNPAVAQPAVESLGGVWTTGLASACPANSSIWSGAGDDMQFRSQDGRVDVEHVISRYPNGFVSSTVASPNVPPGTQWDYRFTGPGSVQVRNLATSRTFTLNRCPQASGVQASGADASAPRAAAQTFACPDSPECRGGIPSGGDAFLDPATLTGAEVLMVQDALIWTGNYVRLKDGAWGKATVESVRAWRRANGLPAAVSLRPSEMASLLSQASAARAAVGWTVFVDQASGATVGVPLRLVSPHRVADGTEYAGNNGVKFEVHHYAASLDHVRGTLNELANSPEVQHLNYRLDKPNRQVLSYDSPDDSIVYLRFDQANGGTSGFVVKIKHDVPAYANLITAFSADFDPGAAPAPVLDASNAPQLFELTTPGTSAAGASVRRVADAVPDSARELWRTNQPLLRPRLNMALETAPSDQPIDWTDSATGMSGEIVVHPASPLAPVPCRKYSYKVRQAGIAVMAEGTWCRRAARQWEVNGDGDRLSVPNLPVTLPASLPATLPAGSLVPPANPPMLANPPALPNPPTLSAEDPLVRALQVNLNRLAYFDGPVDGIASPALRTALQSFEQDENVRADGEPSRAAETLSEEALARIPPPGACPNAPPAGASIVCGHVR